MYRAGLVRRLTTGRMRRVAALSLTARIALAISLGLVFLAAFPWLVAPYSPTDLFVGPIAEGPSWRHPFGTDELGRDIFSRVIWGARVSVTVGLSATTLALLTGAVIGAIAASSSRYVNETIMRLLDLAIAFPAIILAVVLATVMTPGLVTTIIVLWVLYTPPMARVVRGNVLVQYGEDYVAAEKALGAGRTHILLRHVTVNAAAPVIVFMTVLIADSILLEAALSFISVGIQPPTPSWGNIVNDGRVLTNSGGWWVTTFGGLAIFVAVLSLNIFAEGLADAFGAPQRLVEQGMGGGAAAATVTAGGGTSRRRRTARVSHAQASSPDQPVTALRRTDAPLLQIEGLSIAFPGSYGSVDILSGVSFDIGVDEVVGLVGETGSGKSLTGLAIMGLLPDAAVVSGRILYRGQDLLAMAPRQRRMLLGHEIAMIYQDALSALNPAMTVQSQLAQLCRRGGRHTPAALLEMVQLPAADVLRMYPHQLSGGQRQRVLIAMALSRDPALLIADEPTTALDETVQAQIVDLLARLRRERQLSILLIAHDLALVAAVADYVVVMYAGRVCEALTPARLRAGPMHPYSDGLLSSILSLERRDDHLYQIEGAVPAPREFSLGCRFAGRCRNESEDCSRAPPALADREEHHWVACHHPMDRAAGPRVDR